MELGCFKRRNSEESLSGIFFGCLFLKVNQHNPTKIIPARDPKQCENQNKMQCMCDHSM